MHSHKMGFWSLTSLVAGSQIGTGIFLLPATLVIYGIWGIGSWFAAGAGALLLALVFGKLSASQLKTGGPHTFVESAFGNTLGFFTAWIYWVISWFSSPLVVISIVTYLSPLTGDLAPYTNLLLEISILGMITALNLRGVQSAGKVEFFLTILKLLPLVIVPIAGLFFIKTQNFAELATNTSGGWKLLSEATLLTFWGFIGVESATTPAEGVINPKKTIPRALITGTFIVAFVYMFSSTTVMGVVSPEALVNSKAPFASAAQIIFGGNWHWVISIAASLVCLGTLNAWVLTSGQIALGAAKDGHLPRLFTKINQYGISTWGLLTSSLCMIPVLILCMNQNLIAMIHFTIDISVTAFLLIYALSTLSYLRLFWNEGLRVKSIGLFALAFCIWILISAGWQMVAYALLMTLSGLPFYLWKGKQRAIYV